MEIKIYSIERYERANMRFIRENGIRCMNIEECEKLLEKDNGYHERINGEGIYKIYGDIDGEWRSVKEIKEELKNFYRSEYMIELEEGEIKMTTSEKRYDKEELRSYHYYIPKYNCSCENLKKIHKKLKKRIETIDTTIYSNHWFRLPYQTNEEKKKIHYWIDDDAKISDGICQYYSEDSINIDNIVTEKEKKNEIRCSKSKSKIKIERIDINQNKLNKKINNIIEIENNNNNEIEIENNNEIENDDENEIENDDENENGIENDEREYTREEIIMILENLSMARCDNYEEWISIGMCLYNINVEYVDIWENWSKKSEKFKRGECIRKWVGFKKSTKDIRYLLSCQKKDNMNTPMKEIEKIIKMRFGKEKLRLGKLDIVSKKCKNISLENKICLLNGTEHNDMSRSMYIEILDNNMAIKCKHINCYCKIYPKEYIQLNKYETNIIINNNYSSEETINFELVEIFEDVQLNELVYNGLNGKSTTIAEIIYYKTSNIYNYGEDNNWYYYNNHKWINLQKNNSTLRNNKEIKILFKEVLKYYEKNDGDRKKIKKIQDIITSLDDTILKNHIMTELSDIFLIKNNSNRDFVSKLDKNKYLIGFNNGVYDMKKYEFREGLISDYITMGVGYDYNPNYSENLNNLLNFLRDIQPINEDYEYMMKFLSTCLVENKLEFFTILTGVGRNGKSKLVELLKLSFGSYYAPISSTLFTRPRPDANSPDPGLIQLSKKKIIIASEPEKNSKLNTGFIKFITGRDSTTLRNCHDNNPIIFSPTFTTILICNDIPDCDGIDNAFANRLRCINFPSEFVINPNPKKPHQKLINVDINNNFDSWKMDFFLKLVEYHKLNFSTVGAILLPTINVSKWTNLYKDKTDIYFDFLSESIRKSTKHIFISDLYDAFKMWFSNYYPNTKIPNKISFSSGIKVHYTIEHVYIYVGVNNERVKKLGIKHIELIPN
jgi:phage/plasmid-associated DNA primase